MKKLPKELLSKYRQDICQIIEQTKSSALKICKENVLFAGVPLQVYKTCGGKNCKCITKGERHGPYKVVQVWNKGKSKQFSINSSESYLYSMAEDYQKELLELQKLSSLQSKLSETINQLFLKRCIWDKK